MAEKDLNIYDLRCEYRKNPLGIDISSPRISWKIGSEKRNVKQRSYQIQVSLEDENFENIIWDSGIVSSNQSIHVEYKGPELQSEKRYYYRIKIKDNRGRSSGWSDVAYWEMGLLNQDEWIADWITADLELDPAEYEPCPMLRRVFNCKKKIKRARIYTSALGLYELSLNGNRVGDYYFTPGWTSYNQRLQYQTYDVTSLLNKGKNVLGIILGDGWYKGDLMWDGKRNFYGKETAAILQLHVEYEDRQKDIIISDNKWESTTGPILMSEIYHGETYDARKEIEKWNQVETDRGDWSGVKLLKQKKDILIAQENEPVKKIEEIKPVDIITTPDGETVIDMGQNMVGWIQFNVRGESGDKVVLKHAEVLDKEGNFYTGNIRDARQTIKYILKGEGIETFEPHFTFQGFRYLKLESFPGTPSLDNFTGMVIHSDMERLGSFSCSNEMVNQLYQNIIWGQKGNFLDIPTDCPQRDERLGWTGDAQVFIQTASLNMNTALFFKKWLKDLKVEQGDNGAVPIVIPDPEVNIPLKERSHPTEELHSSAAWGDAVVICPWILYRLYGDTNILKEQYESMKDWIEYIRAQGENEYLWNIGLHFGDWLALDAPQNSYTGITSHDFIATAFYAYSTRIFINTAQVLGYKEDVKKYSDLLDNIIDNFNQEFVTPNGRLSEPTQTAHILALYFDLVQEEDRNRIIDTLADYVANRDGHLTTGFVGTPYLCHVLSNNGYPELAYELLEREEYPSWLYPVTKGATTIWEHWDGIKEDGSFWPDDMNSFNHYAYGAIGDWLYQVVAGIKTDDEKVGYKKSFISPLPGGTLTSATASVETMYGQTKSSWEIADDRMSLEVIIPANTTAIVILPDAALDTVRESGILLEDSIEGINNYKESEGDVKLKLDSGKYLFKFQIQEN